MGERDNVEFRDNPDESRYEILVDGRLAGFTEYVTHGQRADFVHTKVGDEYGGRGLASRLVRSALDDARRREWAVVPRCRFVAKFIAEHDDYRDLVPEASRGLLS